MSNEIRYVTPRYENLTRLAREYQCERFLEIGTWAGITAQNFLLTAKEYTDNAYYVGVDLFDMLTPELKKSEHSKEMKRIEDVYAKLKPLPGEVHLIGGFSCDILPNLNEKPFDMIYIDGGHRAETIAQDWKDVQRFIHENTVVVFDDYRKQQTHLGCRVLIDSLDREQWNVEILEPTETMKFGEMNFAKVTKSK